MKIFTIQGCFATFSSRADKSYKLVFETQELTPETVASISAILQYHGFIAFNPDPFTTKELEEIYNLKLEPEDNGKSPAQRMRSVLYKLWEMNNEGFDSFDIYYRNKMEKYINNLKSKLLP